jgi:hypothetical protein
MTSDAKGSFRSHANYLRAFATLAGHSTLPKVSRGRAMAVQKAAVLASSSLNDKPRGTPDLAGVRRSLANAWGTELLVGLSREYASEDELIRLANNWGAVQVYYVAYHGFQAYLLANGEQRPTTHPRTQRMFADRWASRLLQMPPWTLAAGEGRFFNGPPGRDVDLSVHQWKFCDTTNCWDIGAQALRSTREAAIPEATHKKRETKRRDKRRAWQEEEELRLAKGRKPRKPSAVALPQLTVGEKAAVRQSLRRYTAMDYLYRLRVKSNYEDSTMFTDGPQDESESSAVHSDLVRLAASVMLLHELHILRLVGRSRMIALVDTWLSKNMPGLGIGLALRRDLIPYP